MSYRFHHISVRSDDVDARANAYASVLGCKIVGRHEDETGPRLVALDAGTDVLLELHRDDVRAPGHDRVESLGLASAEAAPERLITPEGPAIDIVEAPRVENGAGLPDRPYLHHLSCLVADVDEGERYYAEAFGLRRVFDFSKPGEGGFRLLADGGWNARRHDFTLELIGGPEFGPEQPWWNAHGPHFDHICFACADVEGVYAHGLETGLPPMLPPHHYPEYDLTIAWLYDPEGLHVELMSALDRSALDTALETGEPPNLWTEDWVRDVDWVPPPRAA